LNHVLLTVRAIETGGLKCAGVVLNNLAKEPDLAMTTNAEILRSCLTLPVLAGFDPGKAEFGIGLRQMIPEIEELL
jgi:dethiobiotin synthetase